MKQLALIALIGCKHGPPDAIGERIEPARGLRPGMTEVEAKAVLPDLHEDGARNSLSVELADRVELSVFFEDGRIYQASLGFEAKQSPTESIEQRVVEQWHVAPDGDWTSSETGWRARLIADWAYPRLDFTPYRPLTAGFFGAKVVPPGPLAKVRIGMTYGEAKAALPKLPAPTPDVIFDAGPDGTDAIFGIDQDHRIAAIQLELPDYATAKRVLETAWNVGTPTLEGEEWVDASTGWRAELGSSRRTHPSRSGDRALLDFTPL